MLFCYSRKTNVKHAISGHKYSFSPKFKIAYVLLLLQNFYAIKYFFAPEYLQSLQTQQEKNLVEKKKLK